MNVDATYEAVATRTIVIAFLRGRIFEKHPNRIVVDVDGVGYDVSVPLSTFYGLGDTGSAIALRIHTHVREDALALYGFATRLEQDLFERLIGVSGIGPKLALAVLSGIEPPDLMRAIERGDIAQADRHSRRREKDRRTHRSRIERSIAGGRRHRARRRARHRGWP